MATVAGAAGIRRFLLQRPVPPRKETLQVDGLRAPVEILIDRDGVPHVFAHTRQDLYFAGGYVHARDRLWQMELNRRIAAGRLAELFGEPVLEADRFLRRLGFARDAEKDLAGTSDEAREALVAYASGANHYMARHPLPLEFTLLRRRPEPWAPIDSLAFGRYMAWTQTPNWETELIRSRLLQKVSPERLATLEGFEHAPAGSPPNGEDAGAPPSTREGEEVAEALKGLHGGGSNNWVVAPSHSVSGHALLANDPHLYPRIPPVWYVAHLRAENIDVAGATLPGIPGVIIGHNDRVAWGVTAGMADCEDLFIERPDPSDARRFFFADQSEPATVIHETFAIRGDTARLKEDVLRTRHGPVISGTLGIPNTGQPLALRSALHDWPNPVEGLLRLNQARDWETFRAALKDWTFPVLNFAYADVDGNIGYKMAGRVPIRARGEGYTPVEGWTGENEWTGYVAFDAMPEAFNPPEGFYATANSRPAMPTTHFLARDWVDDSRWRRIIELLQSHSKTSLEDFKAIQADVTSLPAREIMEKLRRETDGLLTPAGSVTSVDGSARSAALRALAAWNGSLAPDEIGPTIYHAFRAELLRLLVTDLRDGQADYVLGRGIDPLMAPVSTFYFRGSSELLAHLERAEPAFLRQALNAAIERLRKDLGDDVAKWQWGRVHRMSFAHPIGIGVPALDRLLRLSRGPVPIGGDADTVAQAGVDPWHPFNANSYMVSYRQIFDTGDWDRGQFILPVGQSGHPGSRHYDDMLEDWRTVQYRPLRWSRPAVDAAVAETITLQPA